jgi:murein DD-endopeptidase MepM/ murein hydrolase activator NlpD
MLTVFQDIPMRVTQYFGDNPDFYKRFGLQGHEGMDVIPAGNSSWMIVSPFPNGEIIVDNDYPRNSAYGNHVWIWYKDKGMILIYGHLEYNTVSVGERPNQFQIVGKMGNTSNSTGMDSSGKRLSIMPIHLHIGCMETNIKCERLNRNNGFGGCIDPRKYLGT